MLLERLTFWKEIFLQVETLTVPRVDNLLSLIGPYSMLLTMLPGLGYLGLTTSRGVRCERCL